MNTNYKKRSYYLQLKLASPKQIQSWGKLVDKPDTINYRTRCPEEGGLFCEKIFGKKINSIKKLRPPRRYKMGYIKLNAPVLHIWFWVRKPQILILLLGLSKEKLEEIIYFLYYDEPIYTPQESFLNYPEIPWISKAKLIGASAIKTKLNQLNFSSIFFHLYNELPVWIQYFEYLIRKQQMAPLDHKPYNILQVSPKNSQSKSFYNVIIKNKPKPQSRFLNSLRKESFTIFNFLKKKLAYLRLIRNFERSNIQPSWIILSIIPVLPPDLRPIIALGQQTIASSDLNIFYRRVIYRNNRLTNLTKSNAPKIVLFFDQRLVQEAVDNLLDNTYSYSPLKETQRIFSNRLLKSLSETLAGKRGRFRHTLLGKRVDYSGRSVIIGDPTLTLPQCGLPRELALQLFEPFLIQKLLRWGMATTITSAKRQLQESKLKPYIWHTLTLIARSKVILLNRAPTLHRLGFQSFQPVLIAGRAITLHPLVCSSFNADFDGDQMAIHIPIDKKTQVEAQLILSAELNLLSVSTTTIDIAPSQDMILGCYYSTLIDISNNFLQQQSRLLTFYFSNYSDILIYYQKRYLHLHSNIWFQQTTTTWLINKVVNNSPVQIQMQKSGLRAIFYRQFQYRLNPRGKILSKYVRTTAGRIFLNQIISNFSSCSMMKVTK